MAESRGATPRPARQSSGRRPATPRAGGLSVRRMARAADDGYEHELLPGLRSSVDAARLADELAFAAARLDELSQDPPGLYAEVAAADDPEEAAWLAFLIAYLSPLSDGDPWAGIAAARVPWASGELPALEDAALGPRAAHDPARGSRTVAAYRAWAQRSGSQHAALTGDPSWPAPRRFDRAFERLALPGFGRAARFELLVLLDRLGVVDVRPWSLQLAAEALDPTVVAAKRVLAIGDPMVLQRRAAELATSVGVPIEALDLGLLNWSRPDDERVTAGATVDVDPKRRAAIGAVLKV
ncbi:MAG: hypothetical protein QOI62_694 [Solirubrobacteraceae bacterium]|nr:hypothetical protein [Solirubrobacteraceae bacterium]